MPFSFVLFFFDREFDEAMPKVGEQVVAEVQKCLCEHGFPRMSEERVSLLKGQVTSVHRADHPVYKLIRKFSFSPLCCCKIKRVVNFF